MSQNLWTALDDYFEGHLIPGDDTLADALRRSAENGLPDHGVAANQGKLLLLLAQMCGARRILEVGTLGGYSTIWLARMLPGDGEIITLEYEPTYAEVARTNLEDAGLLDKVDIRIGAALDSLDALIAEDAEPFDFVFIDADKGNNPGYFERSLALSHPGTIIIIDNVIRDGAVLDADSEDSRVQGVRRVTEMVGKESRVSATALQTVGSKGHDGFMLIRVLS